MADAMFQLTKKLLTFFLLIALAGCATSAISSGETLVDQLIVAKSFSEPKIVELSGNLEPGSALFVFDVDNTLLASPSGQFLASDQWYKWQKTLAEENPAKVRCLLDMQGIGYLVAHLNATENGDSTSFVASLQAAGFDTIAMTARSPQFRSSTERELLRNGFEFNRTRPGDNPGFAGTYEPQRSNHNQKPRDASYQNGIAMLAGQHKGDSLVDLLGRLGLASKYRTVVFFDDDKKNTAAVMETFRSDPRGAIVIQYEAVDISLDQYDIDGTVGTQELIDELYERFHRSDACDI